MIMKLRNIFKGIGICALGLLPIAAFAGMPSADLETDMHKLSGNLRAYPYTDSQPPLQTPPPTG